MKALILAAGAGERLRPLTLDCPKPMLPLGGRPILEHLVALLRRHGIDQVAVNLHYKPEAIVRHFGDGEAFGVSMTYSLEQRLLGSAGAAKALEWFFDDTFVVLYGDVMTDLDLGAMIARHHHYGATATVATYDVPDPERCGIVQVSATGWVTRFVEKPRPGTISGNLANAGIYVLEPEVLTWVPPAQAFDFGQELFPILIEQGRPIMHYPAAGYVLDIGSPERYAQAEHDLANGLVRSFRTSERCMSR